MCQRPRKVAVARIYLLAVCRRQLTRQGSQEPGDQSRIRMKIVFTLDARRGECTVQADNSERNLAQFEPPVAMLRNGKEQGQQTMAKVVVLRYRKDRIHVL